jgi:hypothetical protein
MLLQSTEKQETAEGSNPFLSANFQRGISGV